MPGLLIENAQPRLGDAGTLLVRLIFKGNPTSIRGSRSKPGLPLPSVERWCGPLDAYPSGAFPLSTGTWTI